MGRKKIGQFVYEALERNWNLKIEVNLKNIVSYHFPDLLFIQLFGPDVFTHYGNVFEPIIIELLLVMDVNEDASLRRCITNQLPAFHGSRCIEDMVQDRIILYNVRHARPSWAHLGQKTVN